MEFVDNLFFYLLLIAAMILGTSAFDEGSGFTGWALIFGNEATIAWGGPGTGLLVACIVGLFCASFLVANRIFFRIKLGTGLGFDDWAILCALVGTDFATTEPVLTR
jgi:hypothetical protein